MHLQKSLPFAVSHNSLSGIIVLLTLQGTGPHWAGAPGMGGTGIHIRGNFKNCVSFSFLIANKFIGWNLESSGIPKEGNENPLITSLLLKVWISL